MVTFDSSIKYILFLIGCDVCTIWGCERQVYLFEDLQDKEELCETFDISKFMLPH